MMRLCPDIQAAASTRATTAQRTLQNRIQQSTANTPAPRIPLQALFQERTLTHVERALSPKIVVCLNADRCTEPSMLPSSSSCLLQSSPLNRFSTNLTTPLVEASTAHPTPTRLPPERRGPPKTKNGQKLPSRVFFRPNSFHQKKEFPPPPKPKIRRNNSTKMEATKQTNAVESAKEKKLEGYSDRSWRHTRQYARPFMHCF